MSIHENRERAVQLTIAAGLGGDVDQLLAAARKVEQYLTGEDSPAPGAGPDLGDPRAMRNLDMAMVRKLRRAGEQLVDIEDAAPRFVNLCVAALDAARKGDVAETQRLHAEASQIEAAFPVEIAGLRAMRPALAVRP